MSRPVKVLLVASLASFMGFLDATIVNIAFPDIERDFGGTARSDLSWVLNGYNIAFAALLVPAGRLADLFGRRRMLLWGLGLFVAASAACALAPSAWFLIGARVAQAVGAAAFVPASMALLLPEWPPERRATAVGLWGASGAVAAAVGPSLGGLLIDVADWRWVFIVNVPIGLLAIFVSARVMREARDPGEGAVPDLLGIALVTGALGLVALGLVKAPEWGWGDTGTLAALAAGVALVPLVIARSRRHPAPVLDVSLFRARSFAAANAGTVLFSTGFYAMLLAHVLFLTTVWDYDVLTAGAALTPGPLMAALSAGPAGRLADRFGQRAVAAPGALIYSLGLFWFVTQVGTQPAYVADWLPGTIVTGIGVGLAFPTFGSAAVASVPFARFGVGAAITATSRQLGAVLGVAMLIAVVGTPSPAQALDAFQSGWTLAALAAVGAAVAAAALGRVTVRVEALPAAQPARG